MTVRRIVFYTDIFFIGFLIIGSANLQADTLILKNGKQYEGKVVSQTRTTVNFRTRTDSLILIKNDIQRIIFDHKVEPDQIKKSAAKKKREARLQRRRKAKAARRAEVKQKAKLEKLSRLIRENRIKQSQDTRKTLHKFFSNLKSADSIVYAKAGFKNRLLTQIQASREKNRLTLKHQLGLHTNNSLSNSSLVPASSMNATVTPGWFIKGGLAFGDYQSELQQRLANEWLLGSLLNRGFGLSEEWSDTVFGGIYMGLLHNIEDWELETNFYIASSTPAWNRYNTATFTRSTSTVENTAYQIYSLQPLSRLQLDITAAYPIWKSEDHRFYLKGGLQHWAINAEYELLHFNGILITDPTTQSGTSMQVSPEAYSLSMASGFELGMQYKYSINAEQTLTLGLHTYSLYGTTQTKRILYSLGSISSGIDYYQENGFYEINGTGWSLGYTRRLQKNMFLQLELFNQTATIADSDVETISIDTTNSDALNTALTTYLLNLPGSAHKDEFFGLRCGILHKFK